MQTNDSSQPRIEADHAPLWHTWPADPQDIRDATRVLADYPLKGMAQAVSELGAKRAILFGVGATGGVASLLLAQSGIGHLDLVDPDQYGEASFATQPAAYHHRGQPKAFVQGARAQQISPASLIRAARCYAQESLIRDISKADLILVAGDNALLPLWAGRQAMGLGKPMIQVSVFGEAGLAIVRCYDSRDVSNACPKCAMSRRELNDLTSRHGCDIETNRPRNQQATRTMPTICNVAGALAANEAIKWLAQRHDVALCGEELTYSLFSHQTYRTRLPRNRDCDLPHARWKIEDVPTDAKETTLRCLVRRLGTARAETTTHLRSEISWVSYTLCGSCGRKAPVLRFARVGSTVGRCDCGQVLTTIPQGTRSVVPLEDLNKCWDTPLATLGIQSGEAIAILQGEQWVYFFTSDCRSQHKPEEARS